MTRIKLCAFAAGVLALFAIAPCRADLFATVASQNQILRIDSTTGDVTRTYDLPPFLPMNNAPMAGLAFDGQTLYLSRRGAGNAFDELWRFDVVNEFWLPPTILDTFANPSGVPQFVGGLGYRVDEFGGSLVAVTRNPADAPPSYIFQYLAPPAFPFDPPIPVGPPGELPPNLDAMGADIDPVTGDLWVSVEEVVGSTRTTRLLRTDLAGTVLQTLTPALPPVTLIRGVGFDGGSMFIAGRNLPSQTNDVYEIDRTTGAVLRSFSLPVNTMVGALAGGEVVPEPATASLVVVAMGAGWIGARRRRGRDSSKL